MVPHPLAYVVAMWYAAVPGFKFPNTFKPMIHTKQILFSNIECIHFQVLFYLKTTDFGRNIETKILIKSIISIEEG